ncbi:MAG: hypothetical protein ABIF01_00935 [Candidatus Micrarchaeota archaeon]
MGLKGISGLVVDVGEKPSGLIGGAVHHYVPPDNLYTLKPKYKEESIDCIMSEGLLFKTKFNRILLKEWMNFCKVGGQIIAVFDDLDGSNLRLLKSEIFTMFRNDAEFDWKAEGEKTTVTLKKLSPVLSPGDSIDRWTFGIITNGKKDDAVDRIIESIQAQGIKECEIIVCGKYDGKKKKEVALIEFGEKDELGWITKKKNLIASKAKYQNLAILHDRIFPSSDWYTGMKKYGNYFEVLTCRVLKDNKRAGDWVTTGRDLRSLFNRSAYGDSDEALRRSDAPPVIGLLEYNDWDEGVYIPGFFNIMKRRIWERCPYNETLFWNEFEDGELSALHHKLGIVPRFNPHSTCNTDEFRFVNMPLYSFDSEKAGKSNSSAFLLRRRILARAEGMLSSRILSKVLLAYFSIERRAGFLGALRKKVFMSTVLDVSQLGVGMKSIKEGSPIQLGGSNRIVSALKQKTADSIFFEAKDEATGVVHPYRAIQRHKLFAIKYEK